MSYKIKSILYLSGLILALVTYHYIGTTDFIDTNDLDNNIVNTVTTKELK